MTTLTAKTQLRQTTPLVLLHGWGFSTRVWQPLLPRLQERLTLYCPTYPGYLGGPVPVDPDDETEAVARTLEQIPPHANVLGWSLGGILALQLAATQPHRIGKLILLGATPRFTTDSKWAWGTDPETLHAFAINVRQTPQDTLSRFAFNQVGSGEKRFAPGIRQLLLDNLPAPEILHTGLRLLGSLDLRDAIANIAVPTLVIHGSEDKVIPWRAGEHLHQAIARSQWYSVPGGGHALPVTRSDEIAEKILDFIAHD